MKKILSCFVILVISLTALVSCVITPSGDGHRYNYFSSGELSLIDSYFDFEIPFAPSNEYYLNEIDQSTGEEQGLNYYTVGNTEEEFNAYLLKIEEIPGAVYSGSQADSYGDVWYFYSVGDVCIDIAYYLYEGEYLIDCYFYISVPPSDPDDPGSTVPDDPAEGSDYIYNSFTETDLETLNSLFDIDLPFIPTKLIVISRFTAIISA